MSVFQRTVISGITLGSQLNTFLVVTSESSLGIDIDPLEYDLLVAGRFPLHGKYFLTKFTSLRNAN